MPWAPHISWWWLAAGWIVLYSPPARIAISAGGARLLLRGIRRGAYPRGGNVHLRLWFAQQLADASGATSMSGAALMVPYAKALGAKVGRDVDLHSAPPVTGMLKVGNGAAIEPEVDLAGFWIDGDVRARRQDPHRRRSPRRHPQHAAARRPDRQGRRARARIRRSPAWCRTRSTGPVLRPSGLDPADEAVTVAAAWPARRAPRSHVLVGHLRCVVDAARTAPGGGDGGRRRGARRVRRPAPRHSRTGSGGRCSASRWRPSRTC